MENVSPTTIDEAIRAIRSGQMVIVVDDQHRENEGDLVMAASEITSEAVNFMARYGRGLICVPMTGTRLDALSLPAMTPVLQDSMRTAFSVSVDARHGTTTGISAADRAATIRTLADLEARPDDLLRPGHVFPLRAQDGGVLRRAGHTEAAVDLARLAGLAPAAVVCEIMNDDGTMARWPDLVAFAKQHDLGLITIADLIQYRVRHEGVIVREGSSRLPTARGTFDTIAYSDRNGSVTHLALVLGDASSLGEEPALVRLHSECLTGDALGSLRCDCGEQLQSSLDQIAKAGRGVLVYLRQEGRGIGLANKIRAYSLQDQGHDTVSANQSLGFPADMRDYAVAAEILTDLGARRVRLLTNNPDKVKGLQDYGVEVVERVGIEIAARPENRAYLNTKRTLLGHWLSEDGLTVNAEPSAVGDPHSTL